MKISKLLLLLFVCFNLFSQKRVHSVDDGRDKKRIRIELKFDQLTLDENAKTKGYGYKTANLMELEKLAKRIELPEDYQVKVPEFTGITSNQIKEFFQKNGLDIQDRWKEIVSSMDLDNPLEYLKDSENLKTFISKSEKLASDIESLLITEPELNLKSVSIFLNKAKKGNWRLMARSTGKEDTKELPNAGGNHSEPNVSPDNVSIISAIKKVVASYFKEKSLSQRINAGDQEIFADSLTPVLLQRMIGEKINGAKKIEDIPVGCVVYTKDVEGGMEDVVVIQAAFGHNEGVVNSEVAVDTYYVKDKNIRPVLQKKNQRIVPIQTEDYFGLRLINNQDELKEKQVLDNEAILAIDEVARFVHKYYGEAMDIELVYEPKTKAIYLVQARPLQVQNAVEASYISSLKDIPEGNIAKCSIVSASGGAVRNITNKNQIITGSSLEEALQSYLSGGLDQTQISVVIVKGQAEPTSHAAAIFRGAGKAILTCYEIEKLNNWLDKEKIDLLVDTQREVVLNIANLMIFKEKNLNELIDENLIKVGWFKHPISQRLTITEVRPFFGPHKPKEKFKNKTRKELVEIMKEGSKENASESLSTLLYNFHTLIYEKKSKKLQQLYNVATTLAQEMLDQQIFSKPAMDLSRLYSINFLEALLFQPSQTNKFINIFSVKSVMKEYKEEQRFIKEKLIPLLDKEKTEKITEDLRFLHFARAGCDELYTDEIQRKWLNFVYDIFLSTEENKNIFIKLLTEIEKFDILPEWINISFSSQVRYSQTSIEILENLNNEYKKVESTLKILKSKKEKLEFYDISKWADPKKFYQTLKSFKKTFLAYYESDEFIKLVKDNTEKQLVIVALTSLMNQFVDTFDKSIKELKVTKDVENFKTMLGEYLNLFERWAVLIPEGSIKYYDRDDGSWPLNKCVNKIKEIFDGLKIEERQLNPSPGFSVAAAVLGSATKFSHHFPGTLEDIFMLIHQNLLVISSVFFKKYCDISNISKTKLFSDIEEAMAVQFPFQDRMVMTNLTSVLFDKDKIVFKYNLPLRHHGCLFDLSMNKDGTSSVTYKFVGVRFMRWAEIGAYAFILSFMDKARFELSNYNQQEIIFTITFYNESNISELYKEVVLYIEKSSIISQPSFVFRFKDELEKGFFPIINELFYNSQKLPLDVIRVLFSLIFEILLDFEVDNVAKRINFVQKIFEEGSEVQKMAALQAKGLVYKLIKTDKAEAIDGAINILNKVFEEGSEDQKVEALQAKGLVYKLMRTENDQAIKAVINILNKVFEEGSEDQKVEALKRFGLVNILVEMKNKESIKAVINILNNVFEGDSEKQKVEALQPERLVRKLIKTAKAEAIYGAINILNNVFEEGSEGQKMAALKRHGPVSELMRTENDQAIKAVINILNKVFEEDSEDQKVEALQADGLVSELIRTKNDQAIKAVINILNKVFEKGLEDQKVEALQAKGLVYKLIKTDKAEAIDGAINILNKVFGGDSEKQKVEALQEFGLVFNLVGTKNKESIEAVINILNKVFEGDSEDQKVAALQRLGPVFALIRTKNEKAINAAIEIFNKVFLGGNEDLKRKIKEGSHWKFLLNQIIKDSKDEKLIEQAQGLKKKLYNEY